MVEAEKRKIPNISEEELNALALDLFHNNIFTDRHVQSGSQDLMNMIFMVLALGGLENIDTKSIGLVYEYMSKAGPRAINGYPIFFSCRFLNKRDTRFLFEKHRKLQAASTKALVPKKGKAKRKTKATTRG